MESYFLPPKGIFVSEWRFFIVKTWEGRFTTGIYGVETTEMLPKFYSAQDMPHTTREYPVQNVNSTALKKLWSSSSHICHPEYSMLHEGTNHSSAPNPPVPSYRTYHSYHCLQGARSSFHLWPLLLLTATAISLHLQIHDTFLSSLSPWSLFIRIPFSLALVMPYSLYYFELSNCLPIT